MNVLILIDYILINYRGICIVGYCIFILILTTNIKEQTLGFGITYFRIVLGDQEYILVSVSVKQSCTFQKLLMVRYTFNLCV